MEEKFKEKFVTDSGYIFVSSLTVNFFMTINSIIIARILGPEKLGTFSILQYLGGVIIMFASINLPITVTKFVAEHRAFDKNVIGRIIGNVSLFLLISTFFLLFLIFFFSGLIANYYNKPNIGFLLKIYCFFVFLSVFNSLGISILAGFQKMKLISKLNVTLALLGIPVTLILVYYFGVLGAIFSLIINSSVSITIYMINIPKLLKIEEIKIDFSVDRELTKKLISYAIPLFVSGVAYTIFQLFGPTILSVRENFTDVGVYKVAFGIYTLVLFIPNAINYNLLPAVSNLSVGKQEQIALFISKLLKIVMFITLPVILCGSLFSKGAILMLFGANYIDAVGITHILITSTFFVSLISAMSAVLMGIKRTKILMYIDITLSLSFIVFSYFLIIKYGLMGLAYTYLVVYVPIAFIEFLMLSKYIKLQYELLIQPFIVSIIFLVASFAITESLTGIYLFSVDILMIATALFVEWKLFEKEDKEMIFIIVKSISKKLNLRGKEIIYLKKFFNRHREV